MEKQINENFFQGSVSRNYDTYMAKMIFNPYAFDLVSRVRLHGKIKILELAAGTGVVTSHLLQNLPDSEIIATDISDDMMNIAKEKIVTSNVSWQNVNMMSIPFKDNSFDLVICQFGLMFATDKNKALTEMNRVLKTNGQLLLNTWGNITENPLWQISFGLIKEFFGELPMSKEVSPFSLPQVEVVKSLMIEAGFTSIETIEARKEILFETANTAAKTFITSAAAIQDLQDSSEVTLELEKRLIKVLGDNPLKAPHLALVFNATK